MVFWVEKRRYVSLIMFFLIALEIFYLSSLPGSISPGTKIPFVTILYHFCAFFLFSFFLFFLIKGDKKINSFYIFITLIFSLIYAILDEIHQSFVPLRSPSVNDVLIDFIGLSFSLLIAIFISKKSNQ
ncbi:MAG: VanZ family protein [Nanoarchaeota archaeon]